MPSCPPTFILLPTGSCGCDSNSEYDSLTKTCKRVCSPTFTRLPSGACGCPLNTTNIEGKCIETALEGPCSEGAHQAASNCQKTCPPTMRLAPDNTCRCPPASENFLGICIVNCPSGQIRTPQGNCECLLNSQKVDIMGECTFCSPNCAPGRCYGMALCTQCASGFQLVGFNSCVRLYRTSEASSVPETDG